MGCVCSEKKVINKIYKNVLSRWQNNEQFFSFLYFSYFLQFLNEYIYIPRTKVKTNKFLKIHHLNILKLLLNEIYTGLFKVFLSLFPKKQTNKKKQNHIQVLQLTAQKFRLINQNHKTLKISSKHISHLT